MSICYSGSVRRAGRGGSPALHGGAVVKIKPLIAARPGYINPVLLAKMISTFDQMSGGRICINLIAGQNESEVEGEGVRYAQGKSATL